MKILIAGLGSIGQRHARNLRVLLGDELELTAYRVRRTSPVIDEHLTADASRTVEGAYGIRSFEDLDSALAATFEEVFPLGARNSSDASSHPHQDRELPALSLIHI